MATKNQPLQQTMLPKPSALLLDWDGFKVNSMMQIHNAHNVVLKEMGYPEIAYETTVEMTGHGPNAAHVVLGFSREDTERFMEKFRKIYFVFSPDFQLMPGAKEFYDIIPESLPLAIVSSKQGDMLRAEIAHLGWNQKIRAVVAVDEAPANKPSPVPALHALKLLGIPANKNVWFGGDTGGDIACANAAGLTSILVTRHSYTGAKPDFRYNNLCELAYLAAPIFK